MLESNVLQGNLGSWHSFRCHSTCITLPNIVTDQVHPSNVEAVFQSVGLCHVVQDTPEQCWWCGGVVGSVVLLRELLPSGSASAILQTACQVASTQAPGPKVSCLTVLRLSKLFSSPVCHFNVGAHQCTILPNYLSYQAVVEFSDIAVYLNDVFWQFIWK